MKRMVSLACVLALAVSMMAGCSSKSEETKAAETTADTVAETTAETAGESAAAGDSGKLIMATEAGFAPYEYTEDGETVVGVDVDIANEIAKAMGKELEIQNMSFDSALVAVQQGVVDSAENDYTSFMLKEHHKTPNGHYISETHHDYTTRLLLMNGAFYDGLTDEQKGWIDEAVEACTEEERQVVYRMFKESKEKVIADGAEVTNFEDVDIDAFKALALPIQDKFAADNNMTAELEMIRAAAE